MRRLFGGPFFSSRPTESTLKDQKSISIAVFFQSERREDNLKEETLTDFTTGDLSLLWGWSVSGVGHYEAPIDLTGNTLLGGKKKKKRRSFAGRGVFHTQRAEVLYFFDHKLPTSASKSHWMFYKRGAGNVFMAFLKVRLGSSLFSCKLVTWF